MTAFPTSSEAAYAAQNELRVAIAGAGRMARHHAGAIPRAGVGARLVAVADPDAKARQEFVQACPNLATFESLEALLEREPVDVVHVCTPPATHAVLARAVLESGCHVYVEKPFTETPEQAKLLLALAAQKGLRVCAGHQLLFEAAARRALDLLPSLGVIHHIESYFAFRPVRTCAQGSQPLRADLQLLDVLPHPVYPLLHFLELAAPDGETRITGFELGPGGTVHTLLRRGQLSAALVITLHGRPVDSYLRLVGANGTLHADFVRSSVQHLIGPGTSFIDKTLSPYRVAGQLVAGTTGALVGRLLRRQASYPGLTEILAAFYSAVRGDAPPPISGHNIVETVAVCQQVAERLQESWVRAVPAPAVMAPRIAITGGTGFLGTELVLTLVRQGVSVRVLARREPPLWDRVPGVEYTVADLGREVPEGTLSGIETVIHLAAETSGGFEEHRRNSVEAAERVCRAAAASGVHRFIHVSSLSVYAASKVGTRIREDTAIEPKPRERGPYVWGKVESERVLVRLGHELGMQIKIVRPGAVIDLQTFDPPGRLGRRVGNVFIAVGSPSDHLGIVHRSSAALVLAWMSQHFDAAPAVINLLEPSLPTKRELVAVLRRANPRLRVVWLPHSLLRVLSHAGVLAQKLLRRGQDPIDLERAFAVDSYDTGEIGRLATEIRAGNTPSSARDALLSGH